MYRHRSNEPPVRLPLTALSMLGSFNGKVEALSYVRSSFSKSFLRRIDSATQHAEYRKVKNEQGEDVSERSEFRSPIFHRETQGIRRSRTCCRSQAFLVSFVATKETRPTGRNLRLPTGKNSFYKNKYQRAV
jgi:hypothetical protein